MNKLLYKEFILSANYLSYFFTLFGFMFFLPGYPILCGAFFVCLGIFFSFQTSRESNDIVFSCLLPIKKTDIITSKFIYISILQIISFIFMIIATVIRLNIDSLVYTNNALMNANFFALSVALLIFSIFNLFFVCGFYKTAYYFTKPFISFCIITFILIFVSEAIHHIGSLSILNSFKIDLIQILSLICGVFIYIGSLIFSKVISKKRFAQIDL